MSKTNVKRIDVPLPGLVGAERREGERSEPAAASADGGAGPVREAGGPKRARPDPAVVGEASVRSRRQRPPTVVRYRCGKRRVRSRHGRTRKWWQRQRAGISMPNTSSAFYTRWICVGTKVRLALYCAGKVCTRPT